MQSPRFKAILLDLDGTLLDINLHAFIPEYILDLAHFYGEIPPESFIKHGLGATMVTGMHTDGKLNLDVFFDYFCSKTGQPRDLAISLYKKYYSTVYAKQRKHARWHPESDQVIKEAASQGIAVVIATNPIYVPEAVTERLIWAGIDATKCDLITHVENSHACKPNLEYFKEILRKIHVDPGDCLMVGDEDDDMVAAKLGCKTFLIESLTTILKPSTPEPTFTGTLADLLVLLRQGKPANNPQQINDIELTTSLEKFKKKAALATMTLSRGFFHYPLYEWLMPDTAEREKKLSSSQRAIVLFGLHHGSVQMASDAGEGVLVYVDSRVDQGLLAPLLWSMCGYSEFRESWGKETLKLWEPISSTMDMMRRKHAPMPHVYVMALAVEPERQRAGLGGRLLRALLDDLESKNVPCYLETFKPVNETIYHSFGFKTMERHLIPGTGLTMFSMLKS